MGKINGGFSEGYKIKKGKNLSFSNNKNKKDKSIDYSSYPNGIIPFIFIGIFFIIVTSCVFGIGFTKFPDTFSVKQVWTNSLISISVLPVLLNLLWLIGRTGIGDVMGYSLLKFSRFARVSKIREKIEFYVSEPAINDVETMNDFKEFAKIRRENSKKWFLISFIFYFILAVILIIVGLCIQYT